MAIEHASGQPQGFNNHIRNIAITGAGGTVGIYITRSLLTHGKHIITALSRPDSANSLPDGIHAIKYVDYTSHNSLVSALQGQEALIITLGWGAGPDAERRVIDAAIEAGVQYIMPSEFGPDYTNTSLAEETLLGHRRLALHNYIEEKGKGKCHWIALTSGFWYEYSLAGAKTRNGHGRDRYGFDLEKKEVTVCDDGNTKICTTTWQQSGEAVAKLFALKILPDDEKDESLTLSSLANKPVFITSFVVSQKDMLASLFRVTGEKDGDWAIKYEGSKERYQRALKIVEDGNRDGNVLAMYTRIFYPNGGGNFESKVMNDKLGLGREDLDESTRSALQMVGYKV